MTGLSIRDIRKSYDGKQVVHGLNAEIPDGCFAAIVGPSGCGKSTLLRMIAGLEEITGGELRIGGQLMNYIEPSDRGCAMVFQNYALYPHMTVAENLAYPLRIARLPKPERQTRIEEAARILGLSELLDRRPAQLSGGQRQRVAMGRAIVRKPDVFLFDEPLSNLDAKLRVQMRLEIKRLHRQLGATSVFVTHDQVEAMTMADLLIVMNDGRIEQIGTPAEVYARPATTFAASFIGSPAMSLFPVRIADGVGHLTGAEDHRIDLPDVRATGDTILGLRSEDVTLSPASGKMQVRIELVEDFGATRLAHCRIPSGESLAAMLPKSTSLREDMLAWLDWPEHVLHLFDPLSGERMWPAADFVDSNLSFHSSLLECDRA